MSNNRRPVIAGNWKMHKTAGEARAFVKGLREKLAGDIGPEVVLCPPFTAIASAVDAAAGSAFRIGAQNMSWHEKGAYTGEIAPSMLTELGASHVILGHSERRQLFGETDEMVRNKVEAALAHGLTPIVCVGETLEEREAGLTDTVVIVQVQRTLHGITAERIGKAIFAYEPVWAIGTGKTCDAPEANRVCALLRATVGRVASPEVAAGVRVLYGGSVKPDTIAEQMAHSDIDGALVGGASLEVEAFAAICGYERRA